MNDKISNIVWHEGIGRKEREAALNQEGRTLWFTGLSGSGKSSIAVELEKHLLKAGRLSYRLDGDNLRHGLNKDLGFSLEGRKENIRRVSELAALFCDAACITLVSFISPLAVDRAAARALHAARGLPFFEIFVDTPLAICESRDPKGLYARARRGEISDFTGISSPYEAPEAPELHLKASSLSIAECVERCLALL